MDNQQETKVIQLRVRSSETMRLTYSLYDGIVLYWLKNQYLKINQLYLFNGIILLPAYVSGHKNKMEFCHLSTNCNKNSNVRTEDNLLKNVSSEFLYWFSGFTDAEDNFLITIDRQYVRFRFKICLHIDDVEVLSTIKSNLNVGTVTLESSRNRCSYIIQDYEQIKSVICPIFSAFPLHTSKRLDFEIFFKAVFIKDNKKLSNTDMSKIVSLKNTMNTKREIFTYNTTKSQIIINPN